MHKSITKSKIVGISTAVPKNEFYNTNYNHIEKDKLSTFIQLTGVESRRITKGSLCTSDLAIVAGEKLLKELSWKKEEIDFIIFITQTADYMTPASSIIIQNKLKLKNDIFALDINLGCSGFPYGIGIANSLIDSLGFKKGLLFIGDISSKLCNPKDKSTWPLFGDACSAVAFQKKEANNVFHDFFSDGSKFEDIIVPSHSIAGRQIPNTSSFAEIENGGLIRNKFNMHLNGANIYSFAISKVHERINKIIDFSLVNKNELQYCFLHQANKLINDTIEKKLGLPKTIFPTSIKNFGNTSSATIPLTITVNFSQKTLNGKSILCGFGVGLSLSSAIVDFDNCKVLDLIEVKE